jgi:cytochrome c biogenesis protein CcdA
MAIAGVLVTFLGFLIAFFSLGLTQSVNGRMAMVIVGIIVSVAGIFGLINPVFQKNANWKR